jgi:hypothetical protein
LVLVDPPAGVDFGIQRGRGSQYETLFVQQRTTGNIVFDFSLTVSESRRSGGPNFTGPLAQGPPDARFVYIDVGTYAGQTATPWSRRMKVPLAEITWTLVDKVLRTPGVRLAAGIPGTGTDGGPSCATARLLDGWKVVADR